MNAPFNLRQLAQYPRQDAAIPGTVALMQMGEQGTPYASILTRDLVTSALAGGGNLNLSGATGSINFLLDQGAGAVTLSAVQGELLVSTALRTSMLNATFVNTSGATINGVPVATQADLAADRAASVTSFNARTGDVQLETPDILRAGGAPIRDAHFGGWNTSPSVWDVRQNDDTIATANWVHRVLCSGQYSVSSFNGRTGDVTLLTEDVNAAYAVPGSAPAAPSPVLGDASNRIATTSFVDETLADYAPLYSPHFTGMPTAPTPPAGDSSTDLATTRFVMNAVAGATGVAMTVGNVAALRGLTASTTLNVVRVIGYTSTTAPDGGGGVFISDATDTTTADDGGTVFIDTTGRRWKRQFSGALQASFFGAAPGWNGSGGGFDIAPALQRAFDYCALHLVGELHISAGAYFLASAPTIRCSIQMIGGGKNDSVPSPAGADGGGTRLFCNHTSKYMFNLNGTYASAQTNTSFHGIEFYGWNQSLVQHCFGCIGTGYPFMTGGFERCTFSNFTGCAVYVEVTGDGSTAPYFQNFYARSSSFTNMGGFYNSDISAFGNTITVIDLYNINIEGGVNGANASASAAVASGGTVLTFAAVPANVIPGMVVLDTATSGAIVPETTVTAVTSTTVTLSHAVAGSGVVSGDSIKFVQYAFFDFRYVREILFNNMVFEPGSVYTKVFRFGGDTSSRMHGMHVEGSLQSVFEFGPATYGNVGEAGDHIIGPLFMSGTVIDKIIKFTSTPNSLRLEGWAAYPLDPSRLVNWNSLTGNTIVYDRNGVTSVINETGTIASFGSGTSIKGALSAQGGNVLTTGAAAPSTGNSGLKVAASGGIASVELSGSTNGSIINDTGDLVINNNGSANINFQNANFTQMQLSSSGLSLIVPQITVNGTSASLMLNGSSFGVINNVAGDLYFNNSGAHIFFQIGNTTLATLAATGLQMATPFMLRTGGAPATAASAGSPGQITWDASYFYVCVAANSWKRVAIAAW